MKKILLDTNALIFILLGQRDIGTKAKTLLLDPKCTIFFSNISAFEIAIKKSIGKFPHAAPPSAMVAAARTSLYQEIAYDEHTADIMARMPAHHKDPFDRMLIALAMQHNLTVMTSDRIFKKYDIDVLLL